MPPVPRQSESREKKKALLWVTRHPDVIVRPAVFGRVIGKEVQ